MWEEQVTRLFLAGLQLVWIRTDWLVVNPDGSYLCSMPTIYQRGGLVCHHVPESRVSNYYLVYQRADLSPWCLNVLPGKGLTCHHWSDGLVIVLPASILTSTMLLGGRLSCYRGLTSRSPNLYLIVVKLLVCVVWLLVVRSSPLILSWTVTFVTSDRLWSS